MEMRQIFLVRAGQAQILGQAPRDGFQLRDWLISKIPDFVEWFNSLKNTGTEEGIYTFDEGEGDWLALDELPGAEMKIWCGIVLEWYDMAPMLETARQATVTA